jgi:hypothetical protein
MVTDGFLGSVDEGWHYRVIAGTEDYQVYNSYVLDVV